MTLQLVSQLACFSLSNWGTSRIRVLLACCICRFIHMVYELLLVYYSLLIMSKKYQNDLQFGMEGVLAKITPWYIY
jgi:hypothetical protein